MGNPHVRFADERGVEMELRLEPLGTARLKGAETDMLSLTSPRHTSTLPKPVATILPVKLRMIPKSGLVCSLQIELHWPRIAMD